LGGPGWLLASGQDPRLRRLAPELAGMRSDPIDGLAPAGGSNAAAAAAQPLVPFRSPGPAFSRNIIVSTNLGNAPVQLEPSIVVDPLDPNHLVMAAIDYNLDTGLGVYSSFDGGATWGEPTQALMFSRDFTIAGDPVLAFGRDGTVYLVFLTFGVQEFDFGPVRDFAPVLSIGIARSTDGGVTWSETTHAATSRVRTLSNVDPDGKERGTFSYELLDKPWLAIGPDPANPEQDRIHVTYTEFRITAGLLYADEVPFLSGDQVETTIKGVVSADSGRTWTEPVGISPTTFETEGSGEEEGEGEGSSTGTLHPLAQSDEGAGRQEDTQQEEETTAMTVASRTVQGSQPKVMADGTTVVAYIDTTNDGVQQGYATIMVATSTDGGKTWGDPRRAGTILEPNDVARGSSFRFWGAAFPQLEVGPDGQIYILATSRSFDDPLDDGDVYFLRSEDRGETWAAPFRLNGDDTDRPQFFPSIAVAPDGSLHAMWGDMRDDPQRVRYHIYYTRSNDGGETWGFEIPEQDFAVPDTRVSDFPSNSLKGFPGGAFIGDYFSIDATDEDVFMVWADSRLSEFGGVNQRIAFARQSAIPAPTLFLNPSAGPAGRDVTAQGLGFQPDTLITLTVGGIPAANLLTDERGGFSTTFYMPVTGEGPQQILAYDETGNAASASFFTEFGFDTIQRQLAELGAQQGGPSASPAASPVASPMASPVSNDTDPLAPAPTPTPITNTGLAPPVASV
ncbi:MAG: exo-alpha-sialidase, partial [Chloroflexia bacterium]|nr:exo-alpha-sialidase [Chloroflexia bacterium]